MTGTNGAFRLDMTMMYAVHAALRRDLEQIARIAARTTDDPVRILRTATGWQMFTGYLHVHHTCEDDALWPVMARTLAQRPDDLALLAALEAEHARIDPLLESIDAALVDPEYGHQRLGGLTDELVSALTAHLRHEEVDGLPLIDAVVTDQQWAAFGQEHGTRVGADAPRYLPWLLDGRDTSTTALILQRMPEPLRQSYQDQWRPAYVSTDRWAAGSPLD